VHVVDTLVLGYNLAIATHHPFRGQQPLNSNRAAGMDAAGADPNLGSREQVATDAALSLWLCLSCADPGISIPDPT
jgi:hypothetical protein